MISISPKRQKSKHWKCLFFTFWYIYIHKIFFVHSPQAFWLSSVTGVLSTLGDISCSLIVNLSHTDESWAGQNTCIRICTLWIYSLSTLLGNIDENKIFVCSPQAFWLSSGTWCFEHSGDISCSLLVNPSHTDESWVGCNMCMWMCIYIYIYIYIHKYICYSL